MRWIHDLVGFGRHDGIRLGRLERSVRKGGGPSQVGVLLTSITLALGLSAGVHRLSVNAEYRVWFSDDSPEPRAFKAVQNVYSRNDSIFFVVAPRALRRRSQRAFVNWEQFSRLADRFLPPIMVSA